ncbi:CTLH/CRA C-terminal to lish motif domain-containing protein [Umbelopsis sp. AD052]|nr:CTLH/CRA C-terminal to lish motif domain-containing protein [Umbelopsis sp. AD052]
MNKIKPEQLLELEQPFIKVPNEQLKKTLRNQTKYLEKEISNINDKIEDCVKKAKADRITSSQAMAIIDELLVRLRKLGRKLDDIKKEEQLYTTRTKIRLEHLKNTSQVAPTDKEAFNRWSKLRLDRVLVDYMLRKGFNDTARKMAEDSEISEMVDVELFAQSARIEEALKQHSCSECIQWCSDNRNSLKKLKSTLEFNLRLQEYIELVRLGKKTEAIQYVQKYLSSWSESHLRQLEQAMALLAFPKDTLCEPYKSLYDSRRWRKLIDQFKADNFALCCLTSQPLLSITLQAGLSALKTPQCRQHEDKNLNCPVCDTSTLGALAENLPLSHHVNSSIVCRLSGKKIDENNPPMLLPNGRVYSLQALEEMASKNNGYITCPRTGDTFELVETRKLYIS